MTRRKVLGTLALYSSAFVIMSISVAMLVDYGYLSNDDPILPVLRLIYIAIFAIILLSFFSSFFSLLTILLKRVVGEEKIMFYIKPSPLRVLLWDEVVE
jgi:hypothetical protein